MEREKKSSVLLDFWDAYHSYKSNMSFAKYEVIGNRQVLSATGTSVVISKGTIVQLFEDNITVEAYHAQQFSTNNFP